MKAIPRSEECRGNWDVGQGHRSLVGDHRVASLARHQGMPFKNPGSNKAELHSRYHALASAVVLRRLASRVSDTRKVSKSNNIPPLTWTDTRDTHLSFHSEKNWGFRNDDSDVLPSCAAYWPTATYENMNKAKRHLIIERTLRISAGKGHFSTRLTRSYTPRRAPLFCSTRISSAVAIHL